MQFARVVDAYEKIEATTKRLEMTELLVGLSARRRRRISTKSSTSRKVAYTRTTRASNSASRRRW